MKFDNYSGEKTPIQFQYPKGWNIEVLEHGPTIYTSIESPEEKSGILVRYGDQLMSIFGSSVFGTAMSELNVTRILTNFVSTKSFFILFGNLGREWDKLLHNKIFN